jgi:hypothetical protein
MSVYIDPLMPCLVNRNWPYQRACHLIADTLEELHRLAESIGLKREWFQISNSGLPHYDLTESKRVLAINGGAIALEPKEFCDKMKYIEKAA